MSFAAEWVFVPICLWPLALAAVVFGLRGRRVDDHPFCRRCGFDLFGRSPGARGSKRAAACPGCGADLSRRRAIGVGRRERRRGLVLAALPLLLLCMAWMGWAGWYAAESSEWQAYKPAWWLAAETGSRDGARRDAALTELIERMGQGKLSRPQIEDLTGRALEYQADASKPWAPAWGEWIERVHDAGLHSSEQWRRYASQAVCFRMDARPNVRRGDPFVLRLALAPARVARGRRFSLDADFGGDIWLDGRRVPGGRDMDRIVAIGGVCAEAVETAAGASPEPVARTICYDLSPSLLAELADGPRKCRVSFDALVGGRADTVDPPLAEAHVELETSWRLLPETEPSVRLVHSTADAPVGRPAVSAACRWADDSRQRLKVKVFRQDLAVAMACDVFVRTEGGEWPAGHLAWNKGPAGASVTVESGPLPGSVANAEKVDVVLRPSAAVAARTVDLSEIWGEPVVVRDVEVVGSGEPGTSP